MHLFILLSTLQDATPNTTGYMIAGYSVIFIVLAIYLASLVIRRRNYKRDVAMLEDLEEQEQSRKSVK